MIVTVIRLVRPGGLRSVVAESTLVRHQLLILNRGRKRAPNLRASDRIIAGLCTLLMRPARVLRSAIALTPSTLLRFHHILIKRKYRLLFSPNDRRRPGPKGPAKGLIVAVVEMKRRNPNWGCPRFAQQIVLAFAVEIDKDVVRRFLSVHYRPESGGPSWSATSPCGAVDHLRQLCMRALRRHSTPRVPGLSVPDQRTPSQNGYQGVGNPLQSRQASLFARPWIPGNPPRTAFRTAATATDCPPGTRW